VHRPALVEVDLALQWVAVDHQDTGVGVGLENLEEGQQAEVAEVAGEDDLVLAAAAITLGAAQLLADLVHLPTHCRVALGAGGLPLPMGAIRTSNWIDPIWRRSPLLRLARVTLRPLTYVPLVLPLSTRRGAVSAYWTLAWIRDTDPSSMLIVQVSPRPMVTSCSGRMRNTRPAPGPAFWVKVRGSGPGA